jgi:hypothetical protein
MTESNPQNLTMMETNFNTKALKVKNKHHKSFEEKRFLMGSEYITALSIKNFLKQNWH